MLTLQLTYAPDTRNQICGWYLPCTELQAWLAACAGEPSGSTKYYLAPRSMADRSADGLIALRTIRQRIDRDGHKPKSTCPAGAIPLVCLYESHSPVELWLPLMTALTPDVSVAELLTHPGWDGAQRLVWLPRDAHGHDRLIRLEADDEIDLSVLVKPPARSTAVSSTVWQRPPVAPCLPEHVMGLQIHRDLLGSNSFMEERQSIGDGSDDLMSLDDDGRTSGGGVGAQVGRWFRRSLEKLLKSIDRQRASKPPGATPSPSQPAGRSAKKPAAAASALGKAGTYAAQQLYSMLADQREKQLKKLIALLARDPDRALKYALPAGAHGAPRGVAPPGSKLSRNNVDFSLRELFGGGQPADAWALDAQMQVQLMAAYRAQAERELAAGRYRRAAYIYGHLMADLGSAAMVLEKGKFFIEAAALYEILHRKADQARCLRSAGQLTEAALIYEQLGNFEAAAEMWNSVGHREAARIAWEQACAVALKRYDVLKAVQILETHLDDAAGAESLLWQQWPAGHQVYECTRLGFQRLADQRRVADAHQRLSQVIASTDRAGQTQLAKLCAELFRSFSDHDFRQRVEDQCRVSAVDRLPAVASSEFAQRMQILSSLHADDTLHQRDVRRFQREYESHELQLQVETSKSTERGKLQPLPSARLANGIYQVAVMVQQQLFTISKSDTAIHCSRYAQLTQAVLVGNHCRTDLEAWEHSGPSWCHVQCGTNLLILHVGYIRSRMEGLLLVSPLGGDDFWLIDTSRRDDGPLVGVSDDGSAWSWDIRQLQLRCKRNQEPQITDFSGLIRARLQRQAREYGVDALPTWSDTEAELQRRVIVSGGRPYIAYSDMVMGIDKGQPIEIATFGSMVRWLVPSLPLTLPRLLVATSNELWLVSALGGERPEKVMQDEQFTQAAFLPGGRVAAVTSRELFIFQRGSQAMRLIDRRELQTSQVVALLSLSAETLGILYQHGVLERYRIT